MIYLALGSNLGARLEHLCQAREKLSAIATSEIVSAPLYETDPLDCPPDSPPFLNTVIALETDYSPTELLAYTQAIEMEFGREEQATRITNSPRPVDIDLLIYHEQVLNSPQLTIPHPRFHERLFVLHPLRDLAPALIPPTHANPVAILLELCETSELPPRFLQQDW